MKKPPHFISEIRKVSYQNKKLSEQVYSLYENIKITLKDIQRNGGSLLGHPLWHLENEVLTLSYLVMQHELNVALHLQLTEKVEKDSNLTAQHHSLHSITTSYQEKFAQCQHNFSNLKAKYHKLLSPAVLTK